MQRGAGRALDLYALRGLWVPPEPKEGLAAGQGAAGHGFTRGSALSIREKEDAATQQRRCCCTLLSLIWLLQVGCTLGCANPLGTQGLCEEAESISAAFPSCSTCMARAALLCVHLCQHVAVPIVLSS